jgi:hypothetical protein
MGVRMRMRMWVARRAEGGKFGCWGTKRKLNWSDQPLNARFYNAALNCSFIHNCGRQSRVPGPASAFPNPPYTISTAQRGSQVNDGLSSLGMISAETKRARRVGRHYTPSLMLIVFADTPTEPRI